MGKMSGASNSLNSGKIVEGVSAKISSLVLLKESDAAMTGSDSMGCQAAIAGNLGQVVGKGEAAREQACHWP
jgi:hypothetical protein